MLFEDEIAIGRAGDIRIRHVGGHTADSSIVTVEPEHVCFSGDLLFCGTFPFAGDSTGNPDTWIKNLETLRKAHYKQIVPGHGSICGDDEIARHIDFFKSLRTNIKKALRQGISVEQFIEKGMIPKYYTEGADRRAKSTVDGWYKFYGKS